LSLKINLGLCKKALEIPTLAENDGDIYCKQCYTRKFGIRGVGFGIGAGALGMDSGERFGNTQSQLYVYFISICFKYCNFLFLDLDIIFLQ
jgi:hypothetical protein